MKAPISIHKTHIRTAQVIKNRFTVTSHAACALNANCRWVVTATPIQNRLSELLSLLHFLRLYHYDEQRNLAWESESPEVAIARLKTILRFIMLRRHKDILHLPKRTDMVIPIEFDDQDKAKYDQAKQAAIRYLDDIICSEKKWHGYVNAISKINALRMVCNLGCSTDPRSAASDTAPSKSSSEASIDRESFDAALDDADQSLHQDDLTESTSICTICGTLILTSPSPGPENSTPQRTASMVSNGSIQCRSCFSDSIGALGNSREGAMVLETESQLSCNDTIQGDWKTSRVSSTKVEALVSDLTRQTQAKKRSERAHVCNGVCQTLLIVTSIVFSFWKSTLDLASSALIQAGLTCVQVDGHVPPSQRGAILERFSDLEGEAVLLMSLSCGGIGYAPVTTIPCNGCKD